MHGLITSRISSSVRPAGINSYAKTDLLLPLQSLPHLRSAGLESITSALWLVHVNCVRIISCLVASHPACGPKADSCYLPQLDKDRE